MSLRDTDRWRVVSPHLDEALDLAPGERATAKGLACSSPTLPAREALG